MSLVPGIFQINEPIIFGLPIVLNPINDHSFYIDQMVNILAGYFEIVILSRSRLYQQPVP